MPCIRCLLQGRFTACGVAVGNLCPKAGVCAKTKYSLMLPLVIHRPLKVRPFLLLKIYNPSPTQTWNPVPPAPPQTALFNTTGDNFDDPSTPGTSTATRCLGTWPPVWRGLPRKVRWVWALPVARCRGWCPGGSEIMTEEKT